MADIKRPPVAKRADHETTVHGHVFNDQYHWLRERGNPEVRAYLEAENHYADAVMAPTKELQEKLFQEMVGRIKEDDSTVPYREGEYLYYSRTEKGKQYSIHCRKKETMEAPEEVLLDCNALAEGHEYFDLGVFEVSPNGRFLAYSIDTSGNEHYSLKFKDLATGQTLPQIIENTAPNAEWAEDNVTLYYVILDEIVRPYRIYRHHIGDNPGNDIMVCEETDERFFLSITKSQSRRYFFIGATCSTVTEYHYMPTNNPHSPFYMLFERQEDIRYYPEHHEDEFLILTNEEAKDFRLMGVPCHNVDKAAWRTIIEHREGVKIEDFLPLREYIIAFEKDNGLDQIRVHDLAAGSVHTVEMPDQVYALGAGTNPDYVSKTLRFAYCSPLRPDSVYDYDLEKHERTLLKQKEIPSGHVPEDYCTERVLAKSHDGVSVPVTLLYRKSLQRDGSNPCMLYGYGAYGYPIDPSFRSTVYNFVDRGFVYAVAHIRGGGLLGERWYEGGKLLNKKNTFKDFIAAAEYLVKEQYTKAEKIAIQGGSAGGLLIGAVVNERPDLFHTAVAEVPFVDVINTMLDPTIPLTVTEYDEWGNPHDDNYFEYMFSYAPYEQVAEQEYPNLLVMAGLNDPRVQYWEPAKWTAKLRAMKKGNQTLVLKTNMGAGHGGASGRYEFLRELAFIQSFIFLHLGIDE